MGDDTEGQHQSQLLITRAEPGIKAEGQSWDQISKCQAGVRGQSQVTDGWKQGIKAGTGGEARIRHRVGAQRESRTKTEVRQEPRVVQESETGLGSGSRYKQGPMQQRIT